MPELDELGMFVNGDMLEQELKDLLPEQWTKCAKDRFVDDLAERLERRGMVFQRGVANEFSKARTDPQVAELLNAAQTLSSLIEMRLQEIGVVIGEDSSAVFPIGSPEPGEAVTHVQEVCEATKEPAVFVREMNPSMSNLLGSSVSDWLWRQIGDRNNSVFSWRQLNHEERQPWSPMKLRDVSKIYHP